MSGNAQSSVDILLAPFTANPHIYKEDHPWPVLYTLHPNNGMAKGLNDSEYINATTPFCQQFL